MGQIQKIDLIEDLQDSDDIMKHFFAYMALKKAMWVDVGNLTKDDIHAVFKRPLFLTPETLENIKDITLSKALGVTLQRCKDIEEFKDDADALKEHIQNIDSLSKKYELDGKQVSPLRFVTHALTTIPGEVTPNQFSGFLDLYKKDTLWKIVDAIRILQIEAEQSTGPMKEINSILEKLKNHENEIVKKELKVISDDVKDFVSLDLIVDKVIHVVSELFNKGKEANEKFGDMSDKVAKLYTTGNGNIYD